MTDLTTGDLGITSLKTAITYIGTQARAAFGIDANGDGTVDTTEIFSFSLALLPTLPGIFPVLKQAGPEALDLRGPEFDELVAHIQATDFLPDDKDRAEDYAKAVVFWLNMNRKFVEYSIGFFGGEDVDFNPLDGLV